MATANRAARISEIRLHPKKLRDESMGCIFPPHHKHEFVNARTCGRTSAPSNERKDDQILRMETVTGGETGGECISIVSADGLNSAIVATLGIGGSACAKTNTGCLDSTSDEVLMAGRWSGTVVVWQQECDWGIPFLPHSCTIRLQQSRSAAVIAAAGMTQAIIGVASRISDSTETTAL